MKHALLLLTAALAACSPPVDTTMVESTPHAFAPERVTVTRIGVIEDTLAYGSKRGIYIIKDNHTGQEFIGISGVGISVLGDHVQGKVVYIDER